MKLKKGDCVLVSGYWMKVEEVDHKNPALRPSVRFNDDLLAGLTIESVEFWKRGKFVATKLETKYSVFGR